MALQKFGLKEAGEMDDGKIGVAFEHAMHRIRRDCEDRPNVADVRKITFTVMFRPVAADNGKLESVDVSMDLRDNLPKRKTATYNMQAAPSGLYYNELSREEARQMTLDEGPRSTNPDLQKDDQEEEEKHAG